MRLGYTIGAYIYTWLTNSFNEAEAHAPRIPVVQDIHYAVYQAGFNEAEAHAPRIPFFSGAVKRSQTPLQ